MNQKPDTSDDSNVRKAFALYEEFLSKQKFLAADHLTLAGKNFDIDYCSRLLVEWL